MALSINALAPATSLPNSSYVARLAAMNASLLTSFTWMPLARILSSSSFSARAAVSYTNEHGGLGNRPVKIESCVVKGDPETSQACAQELVGKGVELVLIGLDLFIDYKTYEAAGIPVIGVLPILPPDYTAKALFLTGGNATSQDRKSTRLNSSHVALSRMPSSA